MENRDGTPKIITQSEYITEHLLKDAVIEASNNTCQIFHYSQEGAFNNLIPYASGILLSARSDNFLITATHAIHNEGGFHADNFMIPIDGEMIGVNGQSEFTALPESGSREDDKIDIGIIRLTDDSFEKLSRYYKFISPDDITVNHQISDKPVYFIYGFPTSWTKEDYKRKGSYRAKPLHFLTTIEDQLSKNFCEYKSFSHLIVKFHQKGIVSIKSGSKIPIPDPEGVSGSGLWYLSSTIAPAGEPSPKKLVGVLIESRQKNESVMIATRIDIVTEIIRQKFGVISFPKSSLVKINIS